jgi:hypothetical protein
MRLVYHDKSQSPTIAHNSDLITSVCNDRHMAIGLLHTCLCNVELVVLPNRHNVGDYRYLALLALKMGQVVFVVAVARMDWAQERSHLESEHIVVSNCR